MRTQPNAARGVMVEVSRIAEGPMNDGEAIEGAGRSRFAEFVAALGRGPGRSRSLTREEAAEALRLILAGAAEPHQTGAFLMLMRYRGESAPEIAGLVDAAREAGGCRVGAGRPAADLDWPSYGAGRTRAAPWFLLSALALAAAGWRVAMHGSNRFSEGRSLAWGLAALGLAPAGSREAALADLARRNFAYLPLALFEPRLERLLGLRALFGLRSPVNTAVRLLDPFDAAAALDGVFHPHYLELHLAAAGLLDRPRLLVLKGGGGEAERNPAKPVAAFLGGRAGPAEVLFPEFAGAAAAPREPAHVAAEEFAALWREGREDHPAWTRVVATIALGLVALGAVADPADADAQALAVWRDRHRAIAAAGGR